MDLNIKVNEKNHLDIGGADAVDIAEEFGTPTYVIDENIIIDFILENIENKSIVNNIINLCETKFKAKETLEFAYILKNITHFINKGNSAVKIALNHYYDIPYEEKRKLSYYISTKIIKDLS